MREQPYLILCFTKKLNSQNLRLLNDGESRDKDGKESSKNGEGQTVEKENGLTRLRNVGKAM